MLLPGWLAYSLIGTIVALDLVIVSVVILLGALFIGFVSVKAFSDYIEQMVDQLIRDVLAHLENYIRSKPDRKITRYTKDLLGFVKTVYSSLYWLYRRAGDVLAVIMTAAVGALALAGIAALIILNAALALIVYDLFR